ncbi:MAG: 30S ribosomal protein S8e [Candidatus Odinarchaeia archaeon]
MARWQGRSARKPSGGRLRPYRGKRLYELGREPTETVLGEPKLKFVRVRGGGKKLRLVSTNYANVVDPKTGKVQKVEIESVEDNVASVDYKRRGVITKGAIIKTKLGLARVTSRPGQHGIVNAVLIS